MRLEISVDRGDRAQTLSVYMLGRFRVLRDGEPVPGMGSKARQLLKILVANRRKCLSKDMLMEMMWPEHDPGAAAVSLKVAAHSLRSALDPVKSRKPGRWIIVDNGTYRVNPDADIWIDTEQFLAHYRQGKALLTAGSNTAARVELGMAEQLYKGDYLEEDAYEDWTVVHREELRDLYLDMLGNLAALSVAERVHEDAIRYCHRIILADPCREDAYRMLIRSHGALNQIARAGSWYAVCRSTLQRDIGAAPSAETFLAFESLFNQPQALPDVHTA